VERSTFEISLLEKLSSMWVPFTKNLPKNYEIEPALNSLHEFDQQNSLAFLSFSEEINSQCQFLAAAEQEEGMNSPGILWDRLTILNCKFFFTDPTSKHFNDSLHSKNSNINSELQSVLNALHIAKPAKNILLAKEATDRQKISVPIGSSLWNLQSSNLAMWINQDLLYTVNIDEVDSKRLRDYIRFFSIANRIRNTAIENIELYYSSKILMKG